MDSRITAREDGNCFACGRANETGLGLSFALDRAASAATATTVLDIRFAGWEDKAHGGIIATLLDEAMVYACRAAGSSVATAELNVRYRRPVPTGQPLALAATVTGRRGKLMTAEAELRVAGRVHAHGKARLFVLAPYPPQTQRSD